MIILGIETSCDETATALVRENKQILAHKILSQSDQHARWGGVIPELAARGHLDHLDHLIKETLEDANLELHDIDGVAATGGPGLIGGVIVGVTTAKILALCQGIPFLAINHLAAHALTVRLTHNVDFPYLTLLVSGGHCQLIIVKSPLDFQIFGETLDDAVGEAFDKVARLLDLPYPGGPAIEQCALTGDPYRFVFPCPLLSKKDLSLACSFSLSGLKTSVRYKIETLKKKSSFLSLQDRADCAASFQYTIGKILRDRVLNALKKCQDESIPITCFVLAGGVASNFYLRSIFDRLSQDQSVQFVVPSPELCTDNAAMIAWAGVENLRLNQSDALSFKARPRWPLTDLKRNFS